MVRLGDKSGVEYVLDRERIRYNSAAMNQPDRKQQDEFRSAVTMTVVWVAGLTLIIIFVALLAGILLDKFLNSKPLFTVILTIASIPLTIYTTFRVVKAASSRIQPVAKRVNSQEEPHRGENN